MVLQDFFKNFFNSFFEGFALWRKSENHASLMSKLRTRIVFSGVCGVILFLCVSYRLANIMVINQFRHPYNISYSKDEIVKKSDIVDRNGELLATSLSTASCYVDPSVVIDPDDTALKLSKIAGFPDYNHIKQKLKDKNKHFVWITRHVTPQIQEKVFDLGLPGVKFQRDYKRIYIHGNLFSHVIGCSDIDGNGVCGLEKQYTDELFVKDVLPKKLVTTLDLRIQSIIYEELNAAIEKFSAEGGNAILMSVDGQVLAMVSLPDFDPNNLKSSSSDAMFNRNTLGSFEQGSILKILNTAIALDSGSATLGSRFDATAPIKIGRFSIKDFKGKNRPLTLAEAFVFSSNIASAKIAQVFGPTIQKKYMEKFGMLGKPKIELPELGHSIVPTNWTETTCMTVSYGYGLAVTPLQLLTAITSIVNDGIKVTPTLIYGKSHKSSKKLHLVSSKTSETIRDLMRAVVCFGTGKKASVDGVEIFGKTGTAYKLSGKGYGSDGNRKRITTFLGGFPKNKPEYMLLISLDNPKATSETFGYATAGWNIAPTAKNVFNRIVPILYDGQNDDSNSELKVVKYLKLDK